jgi:hypothetical protein
MVFGSSELPNAAAAHLNNIPGASSPSLAFKYLRVFGSESVKSFDALRGVFTPGLRIY